MRTKLVFELNGNSAGPDQTHHMFEMIHQVRKTLNFKDFNLKIEPNRKNVPDYKVIVEITEMYVRSKK